MDLTAPASVRRSCIFWALESFCPFNKAQAQMSAFKDFERKAVRMLAGSCMPDNQLDSLLDSADLVSYEYTGVGYFLTVRHSAVPFTSKTVVWDRPVVIGRGGGIECGFLVFLENGTLTLECHSWGDDAFPEKFREQEVEVATSPELRR